MDVSHIRAMAEALGISRIYEESQRVVFEFLRIASLHQSGYLAY